MKTFCRVSLASLALLVAASTSWSANWDGDAPFNGGVTYFDWGGRLNFYGNSDPAWNSSTPLYFSYNNNSHTTLNQNIGYKPVQSIIYEGTFTGSTTLQGSDGFDLYWKVENFATGTHTINVPLIVQGATFELNPISGNLTVGGGIDNFLNRDLNIWGNTGKTLTLNSTFSGAAARLILNENSTVILNGNQTYTGQTWVKAGVLRLGASDRIADSSDLNLAGGTFDLNGNNEEVANLVNSSSGNVTLGAGQLRVNQSSDATYSGVLSGTGTFVKKGTALLTLGGANSYSGQTYIDNGELRFNVAQNAGHTGIINIGAESGTAGAALAIGTGGVTLSNPLNVRSGASGTKSIVAQNSSGMATFSGNLTLHAGATVFANSGGNLTLSGDLNTSGTGNQTLTVGGANNTTLSGLISGGGKIVKQGAGILTLGNSANSYTGNTEIDLGTLAVTGDIADGSTTYIGHGLNSGNATLALAANGVNLGGTVQVNVDAGAGTRTIDSTATSGNTTISGSVIVNKAVTLQANAGSTLNLSGNMTVNNSSQVTVDGANNVNLSGAISGASAALVKNGAGVLMLSGGTGNSYSGATTVNAGRIDLNKSSGNAIVGALTIGDGTGGANADGVRLLASDQISDSAAVTVNSSGQLNLNGFNDTILSLGGSGNVALGGGNLTIANSSLATHTGVISGGGNLVKDGANVQVLSGANSYTGGTTINAGTLRVGAVNALPTGTAVTLANTGGAILDLNGNSQTISSLAGGGGSGGNVTLGAGALTLNQATSTTYGGAISGTGSLTKNGSGRLTITGINSYSGVTLINAGSITVDSGAALAGNSAITLATAGNLVVNGTVGNVTINSGGFLKGSGTVGTLIVNAGGAFSPGNSPGTEAAGNTTWAGAGSYIWEFNDFDASQGSDPGWDFLDVTGTLTITATSGNPFNIDITSLTLANAGGLVHDFDSTATQTWTIASASGGVTGFAANKFNLNLAAFQNPHSGTWSIQQSGNNVQLHYEGAPLSLAIPEPSMAILMVIGAGLICVRRRRG